MIRSMNPPRSPGSMKIADDVVWYISTAMQLGYCDFMQYYALNTVHMDMLM